MPAWKGKLIGFGCKQRRGKDTAAEFAVARLRQHGIPARIDAFAFSLKEAASAIFGFSTGQLYGELKAVEDLYWRLTPRDVLQRLGTEALQREFGRDIWVRTLFRRLRALSSNTVTVVADVRFRHEFDALKEHGGYLIRVDRNVADEGRKDQHLSEIDLDDCNAWDAFIDNNGSLADLRASVDSLIDHLV